MEAVNEKQCKDCEKVLPIEAFHKNARCRDGRVNRCRTCMRDYMKRWYSERPSKEEQYREQARIYKTALVQIRMLSRDDRVTNIVLKALDTEAYGDKTSEAND